MRCLLVLRCLLAVLLTAPLLLAGCAGQKALVEQQARTIDSLFVVERTMRAELYALQDSILYYDDIDSGYYYRQDRARLDRINRLEYLLTARRDTLCSFDAFETLGVDELFEPASALLSDAGKDRLATLAAVLDSTFAGYRFRIEGHADSTPLGGAFKEQFPSNWELSAARAAAVVRFYTEDLGFDAARFEVAAFGAARPVASNSTARGRRQNRRISIVALPD